MSEQKTPATPAEQKTEPKPQTPPPAAPADQAQEGQKFFVYDGRAKSRASSIYDKREDAELKMATLKKRSGHENFQVRVKQ